ncbi:MAG: NADH-quinone oxidoreductase subunit C [Endomicrobiales bacterium]|nr:NADH-quinone oxidoreductase subunit C [Endomicrobiales bacterium]
MTSKIQELLSECSARIIGSEEARKGTHYIEVNPAYICEIAEVMHNKLGFRFITISGVDARKHIELIYSFADDKSGDVVSIKTKLFNKKDPAIDSLSKLIKGASWIEREVHEFFGVKFAGHQDLNHLLLGEDWPEGDYPYRHEND